MPRLVPQSVSRLVRLFELGLIVLEVLELQQKPGWELRLLVGLPLVPVWIRPRRFGPWVRGLGVVSVRFWSRPGGLSERCRVLGGVILT